MDNFFSEWLQSELNKRDWNQADLARASGLTPQAINAYLNQRRTKPNPQALAAIARALNLPIETVYQAAGLPHTPAVDPAFQEWAHILAQLPQEEQERLKLFARAMIEDQERKKRSKGKY